jgi:hypothetical protein
VPSAGIALKLTDSLFFAGAISIRNRTVVRAAVDETRNDQGGKS